MPDEIEIAWIEEVPEVAVIDDIFHFHERSGAIKLHMATTPHVALALAHAILRVHREWAAQKGR